MHTLLKLPSHSRCKNGRYILMEKRWPWLIIRSLKNGSDTFSASMCLKFKRRAVSGASINRNASFSPNTGGLTWRANKQTGSRSWAWRDIWEKPNQKAPRDQTDARCRASWILCASLTVQCQCDNHEMLNLGSFFISGCTHSIFIYVYISTVLCMYTQLCQWKLVSFLYSSQLF